ncbi:MAG: peptidylprolyl isomerase [bacterium]|jgi:peptidyl-prolyl cis-trans isomerase B (cyclophilin B)|nr:peptidylprolyl isomerase [bacterium]
MRNTFLISLVVLLTFFGCSEPEDYLVVIDTEYGEMKAVLYDETPLHKENFIKLTKEGAFDKTIFHRVIQNFMIQGGDVNAKSNVESTIDYTIPAEIQENPSGKFLHTKGALAAARQGDDINPEKESSGCQFYIVDGQNWKKEQLTGPDWAKLNLAMRELIKKPEFSYCKDTITNMYKTNRVAEVNDFVLTFKDTLEQITGESMELQMPEERINVYTTGEGSPHLDDEYTVFGRVVEGLEVIDSIAAVTTAPGDRPMLDIPMTIELEGISKQEIKEKYGL